MLNSCTIKAYREVSLFLLSKTLGVMIIPPGLIIVLLVLSLAFFLLNRRKTGVTFLAVALSVLFLLSIEPVKNALLTPLEDKYPYPDVRNLKCEAIVVLRGGIIPHSPAENFKASVFPSVAKRLYEAMKIWKVNRSLIVVSGGRVLRKDVESEAEAMKRFLVNLGIPENSIIKEDRSRNTLENAIFTKRLLEKFGIGDICLVTSAFHMQRSVDIFRTAGFKVEPVPSDYRASRAELGWYSFIPIYEHFSDSATSLREYIGLVYFKLIQKHRLVNDLH